MIHAEIAEMNEGFFNLINTTEEINTSARSNVNYQYDLDCNDRVVVICNNAKSILLLSDQYSHTFYSAKILCRVLVELSAKIKWILNDDLDYKRDARWLAFAKDAQKNIVKQQKEITAITPVDKFNLEKSSALNSAIEALSLRLHEHDTKIKINNGLPNFRQILSDIDSDFLYSMYCTLSDEVHVSLFSIGAYSSEYGLNEGGVIWQWWNIYNIMYISLLLGPDYYLSQKFNQDDIIATQYKYLSYNLKSILALAERLKPTHS